MRLRPLTLLASSILLAAPAFAQPGYRLVKQIAVPGEGGQDYLYADGPNHRVYVSHATSVAVIDTVSDTYVGSIEDLSKVHGIAVADSLGRGFITNGGRSNVTIFDLKTLKHIAEVPAGKSPDGIVYDPATQRVFAFDHVGGVLTVFEAATGHVVANVELGGAVEFPVVDGKGGVWANLEDKSILVKIDARTATIVSKTPVTPLCEEPASMAIHPETRRLFIGCGNKVMAIADADTGRVITTVPIGEHVDATAFDAGRKLILNANRATVTVVQEQGPDQYAVLENFNSAPHANTLAIDPTTHRVYLAASQYETAPVGPDGKSGRQTAKPGTFTVFVFAR
jgi:YVTN family beta-propeller protein